MHDAGAVRADVDHEAGAGLTMALSNFFFGPDGAEFKKFNISDGFFVVLAIRNFIRPIKLLATATQAISDGDYSQRVKVASQDEVGALASAFNRMSQDLENYHNKMEELVKTRTDDLTQTNRKLQISLKKIKTLSGFLPICASCKKIRDDKGYWNKIESYIAQHSEAEFSHSFCPECLKKLYPEFYDEDHTDKKD